MGVHQLPVTERHRNPLPLNHERLEALIAEAIDLLDMLDGDPDFELDEPDIEHDGGEEEWQLVPHYGIDQTADRGLPEWLSKRASN